MCSGATTRREGEQPSSGDGPTDCNVSGNATDVNFAQHERNCSPMWVKPSESVIAVRAKHVFMKKLPTVRTDDGRTSDVT